MIDFAHLVENIDKSTKTTLKIKALEDYFKNAISEDKVWTIALFSSKRPKRAIKTSDLRVYASEVAKIPLWLFEESYHIVGDLAETIALVVPGVKLKSNKKTSLSSVINEIINLKNLSEKNQKKYLAFQWLNFDYYSRFVFNKLITGGFRIGVSQKLMTKSFQST